jgi:hypothetical protein
MTSLLSNSGGSTTSTGKEMIRKKFIETYLGGNIGGDIGGDIGEIGHNRGEIEGRLNGEETANAVARAFRVHKMITTGGGMKEPLSPPPLGLKLSQPLQLAYIRCVFLYIYMIYLYMYIYIYIYR